MHYVAIEAYETKRGMKKLRVTDLNTKDEHNVVADSTDMARLWRKVRNWHGDVSALDGE